MIGDYINTCTICGKTFHTTTGHRLMCGDCLRAENERVSQDALAKIAAKRARTRATRRTTAQKRQSKKSSFFLVVRKILKRSEEKHENH